MKLEKKEDLFNTEHLDVVQATLIELEADEERRLKGRLKVDREILKSMDSRPRLFERCTFQEILLDVVRGGHRNVLYSHRYTVWWSVVGI